MGKKDTRADAKLHEEAAKFRIKCKCGCSMVIYPFEHREFKICRWCGLRVYEDTKKQKEYDFKIKMQHMLSR